MQNILNTVSHPMDSPSVLNWIVWRWSDSSAPIIILTQDGEGEAMDNRLRVRLSNVRRGFKDSGIRNYRRFGISSRVIPWTDAKGVTYDALCMNQTIMPRHIMGSILAKADLPVALTQKKGHSHG